MGIYTFGVGIKENELSLFNTQNQNHVFQKVTFSDIVKNYAS